jgi:hypothetical protein
MNGPLGVLKRNQEAARTKVRKFYIESAWNLNMNLHLIFLTKRAAEGLTTPDTNTRRRKIFSVCFISLVVSVPSRFTLWQIRHTLVSHFNTASFIYPGENEKSNEVLSVITDSYRSAPAPASAIIVTLQCYNPCMNYICYKPDESES